METKICSLCKQEKPTADFPKCSRNKDGLDTHCKSCRNRVNREYRESHKEQFSAFRKSYYLKNRDAILAQKKASAGKKKERKAAYDKVYRSTHKNKLRDQKRLWERNSANHKIVNNLRRRIAHALKGESKSASTLDLIGCSVEELKSYLQKRFVEGMAWDNYGKWHIDHIIPCSHFDLSIPEQQKRCFNFRNLQPLWAEDNLKKAYKYENERSFK